jgi:hypothetical protein
MISTRSVGLLIDTVVCLTLAKWETVSGQFGGYLTGLGLTRLRPAVEKQMLIRRMIAYGSGKRAMLAFWFEATNSRNGMRSSGSRDTSGTMSSEPQVAAQAGRAVACGMRLVADLVAVTRVHHLQPREDPQGPPSGLRLPAAHHGP